MKELKEYPGYFINRVGDLYSIKSRKFLRGGMTSGYTRYTMNRGVSQFAHRLVAMAYIPNPNNLPQVNHINENKLDNRVENLEWCTGEYNTQYSCSKEWILITPSGETINVTNLKKFARDNNINASHLIARGKSHGYKLIRPSPLP